MNKLHEMKLHEVLHPSSCTIEIIRVPGGWIYTSYFEDSGSTVFVPLNDEFQESEDAGRKATPKPSAPQGLPFDQDLPF